ncbi:MAG: N-acetyltransferase family protein [Alphaproteobacteria bacterium]
MPDALAPASLLVRASTEADTSAIQAIYARHVLHGTASFEEVPPDAAEMARRRADVLTRGLPHLVAECRGRIVGYAYAGPYRPRPAYRFAVENSVYVAEGLGRRGVGSALLAPLIDLVAAGGWRQMIAVIGDSANEASIALHARHGFRHVGVLASVGFKHGRWLDSVIMQRPLGAGDTTVPAAT